MKLKLNKLFILLVFVCAFFVFTPYVFADEPLECWYSISGNNPETLSSENRVQLYIKAQNGKVDYSFSQFKKNVNGREVQYSSAKIVNDVIPFESIIFPLINCNLPSILLIIFNSSSVIKGMF